MSVEDFDLPALARYLHLQPQRLTRLVERGELPGRRIGDQWRFARAEIHHWLENRLGAGGSEEMDHVENVLDQSHGMQQEITVAKLLPQEAIAVPLSARTKNSVITSMVELAACTGWLWDPEKMADAVRQRENLHSTALEEGVALLHPRRPLPQILGQSFLAMGVTVGGIPFSSETNGRLTDVFFLICSADDATHLRILSRVSRLLREPDFLPAIRASADARDAWDHIEQIESRILPRGT